MCNRILHSQKKQGRAFGVAPQVLDAAGQTFAKCVLMWSQMSRRRAPNSTTVSVQGCLFCATRWNQVEPGRNQVEPGRNHCKMYYLERWSQVGTRLNQARNQVEIEGCLLRNHHFLFLRSDGTRSEPG